MGSNIRQRAERVFLKVVPKPLQKPIRRSALKGSIFIDGVRTSIISIGNSLSMTAQPRFAMVRSVPTTSQVVANYTRGLVLFGRSPAFPAPFVWRSFPFRAVITQETAKIPRYVRNAQRSSDFKVKFDEDLEDIIRSCQVGRDQSIWITPALIDVYREVHRRGFVSTVGVYRDDQLLAGLWGISVGGVFGIMSMFHRENGAGSLAVGAVIEEVLSADGRWSMIDSGVISPHFRRFGAFEAPQDEFCEIVWQTLK